MANPRPSVLMALAAAAAALLLGACEGLGVEGLPPNQPIPAHKFSAVRAGITYAEFETLFGAGWMSRASGTDAKYWFLDDGRTVVVPAEVWKSPKQILSYRIIGIAPIARAAPIPVLSTSNQPPPLPQRPTTNRRPPGAP